MAASGYFNTSNQYVKFWIEIITNSQNISANTSNVTVKVWAKRTNTGYTTWGTGSVTLKVNGSYYNSGNKQIEITSSSKVYHSWTGNISHNSDGTKKLTCSAAINIPTVLSSSEQSYSVNLTTIPRTSSFTLSKSSCELGTSFTVNISRASSSFTHSVSYIIGGERRYIQNWNSGNISPSYTPPITDAVYMPNSTTMNTTITVDTYSGNTLIGSSSKTLPISCPANIIPSFSNVSAKKVSNGPDANVSCLVQGYSKIEAVVNGAKGIYDSKINKYYVSINEIGYSGSSNTYISAPIQSSGDISVRAEVVDTRGRKSGVYGTTIRVEPYTKPIIKDATIRRVNNDYIYDTEGNKIHVRVNVECSSLLNQNSHTIEVKWREANGVWSSGSFINSGEDFYFNDRHFSTDIQYQISVTVTDKITSVTSLHNISTGEVTMDFRKGGKGVAIGKVSESDMFDVGMDSVFRNQVQFERAIRNPDNMPIDYCREGVYIANGSDLNTYKTAGRYYQNSNADTTNIKNIPEYAAFSLDVLVVGGMLQQRFYAMHSKCVYYRTFMDWENDWSRWNNAMPIFTENSNGRAVRFGDGTMICWKTFVQGCEKFNTWGSVWESYRFGLGNWPSAFIDRPSVILLPVQSEFTCWVENCTGATSTSCGSVALGRATNALNVVAKIDVVGVGRWK